MTLEVHPPHNHPNQLLEHSLAPAPAETLWASSLSGEPGLRRPPRRALANSLPPPWPVGVTFSPPPSRQDAWRLLRCGGRA